MEQTAREAPRFFPRSFAESFLGPPKVGADSLEEGLLNFFQDCNPGRLQEWKSAAEELTDIPIERIYFLILLCGARFEINRPAVESLQQELWEWFTWRQRHNRMRPELAELLINILTPDIEKHIATFGWRVGQDGPFRPKASRPPSARGAQAASILLSNRLSASGTKKTAAKQCAADLLAVLQGRESANLSEMTRYWTKFGRPDTSTLDGEIERQYEYWLVREGLETPGINTIDLAPDRSDERAYTAWVKKHKALPFLFTSFGSKSLSKLVLERIPAELWAPFESDLELQDSDGGNAL